MTTPAQPAAVPPQAITAAQEAISAALNRMPPNEYATWLEADEALARAALEAAVPHLAAAKVSGEFIGSREQNALHDAYQQGVAAGRAACVAHLRSITAGDLLDRHGLERSAGAHHVLAAAASDLLREQP